MLSEDRCEEIWEEVADISVGNKALCLNIRSKE